MVSNQAFHGALEDNTHLHAKPFGSLFELCGEGTGYGTDAVDGQPGTAILDNVACQELRETPHKQFMHLGHLAMVGEERCQAGKETVDKLFNILLEKHVI